MNHQLTNLNAPLTMSSQEIAELTGKEHFHIIRDIRSMLEALGFTESSFGCSYKDTTGRTLPAFHLPKDLTITLVTGYSIPLRHRVVTRWMELESVKPTIAAPGNLREALLLALAQEEKIESLKAATALLEAEVTVAAPKVEVYDRVVADKELSVSNFAKMLNGVNSMAALSDLKDH